MPLKAGPGDGVLPLGHPAKRHLERAGVIWSRAASGPWLSHFYTHHQNIHSCWQPALLLRSNTAGCLTFSLKALPPSSALYAGQGTTPNPKAGIPHAYLRHPSGAFFHFLAHPLGQAPLPRVSVCPADTPPGPLPFPLRESARPSALEHPFLWGQESSSTRSLGCPSPRPGLPSTPPTLRRAWRQEGRPQGPRPTHLPSRSQPTLQQDAQEGDGGQKSYLVLHGDGGSGGQAGL